MLQDINKKIIFQQTLNKAENIFEDDLIDTDKKWISVNIGITRVLSGKMVIYGGLGISMLDVYRQYHDRFEILGKNGKYWIKEKENSITKMNALTGLLYHFKKPNWTIQTGIELQPFGISFGIGYIFF